jgi:hypothetical protein
MLFDNTDLRDVSEALIDIANSVRSSASEDGTLIPVCDTFFRTVLTQVQILAAMGADESAVRDIQVIAGQGINILMRVKQGLPNADKLLLTSDKAHMIASPDKTAAQRGPGFMDMNGSNIMALREANQVMYDQAEEEGNPGEYYRGDEKVNKMKANANEQYAYNPGALKASLRSVVLYVMNHGFLKVPHLMQVMTSGKNVSTFHETTFLTNALPDPFERLHGPGHLQGKTMDIKQVKEGYGIQWSKFYNESGQLVKVYAQYLTPGSYTIAFPVQWTL